MNELVSNTPITRITPGAKARALLQTVNKKLNRSYQEFDLNLLKAYLPFATGRFLDYLGDMMGLPRLGAQRASASAEDQVFRIYVASGTFGNLNGNADISFPAGEILSTEPNGGGVTFRTVSTVVLNRNSSSGYLPVESVREGANVNVGQGTVSYHTFSSYTAGSGLLVTNDAPLNNGASVENDESYRFRLSNQTLAAEGANETSVRLALLSIPGVANIVQKRFARGIGSYEVIIQSVIPNTPATLISTCQTAIDRVTSYGTYGTAVAPNLTGMSFQITVTWRNDATAADRTEVTSRIQRNVADYINNLAIGEDFIYNELIERVMGSSDKILNIGTASKAIDLIYVHRESDLQDNKRKELLIQDYSPFDNERLIIEPTEETPVVVLSAN